MAFESLSETYEFTVEGYPDRWLPLTYLYDPDLPLFPTHYFHVLNPDLPANQRPGEYDRAYGFIQRITIEEDAARVLICCNKKLDSAANMRLADAVRGEVCQRLGIVNPVELSDLEGCLSGSLSGANRILKELWYQVADGPFSKRLPFGALWDPIFGLARFIASWYSDGGRKGELIQTHYFCRVFGQRISNADGIHADFYLLPTYQEFRDQTNPLSLFPRFAGLLAATKQFTSQYCDIVDVGSMRLSAFRGKRKAGVSGVLNQAKLLDVFERMPQSHNRALTELYNAFNRGPSRSVLAIMMIADLQRHGWSPEILDRKDAAMLYWQLGNSYQSPKVMHLYAQLCFGNQSVLPIDNWVSTFLMWPLGFGRCTNAASYTSLFDACMVWGKVERLIWMAVQARKVHSSSCEGILWCVRYGNAQQAVRGSGPLSCKICLPHFRDACAAYESIREKQVSFNALQAKGSAFNIVTSAQDNNTLGQRILRCDGIDTATAGQRDEYSPKDRPADFHVYPAPDHNGSPLTVSEFIEKY